MCTLVNFPVYIWFLSNPEYINNIYLFFLSKGKNKNFLALSKESRHFKKDSQFKTITIVKIKDGNRLQNC